MTRYMPKRNDDRLEKRRRRREQTAKALEQHDVPRRVAEYVSDHPHSRSAVIAAANRRTRDDVEYASKVIDRHYCVVQRDDEGQEWVIWRGPKQPWEAA